MIEQPRLTPRVQSCVGLVLRLSAFGAAGLFLLVDLTTAYGSLLDLLISLSGAAVVLAVFWLRPLATWAAVACLVSIATSLGSIIVGFGDSTRSITELFWLPVLIALVVREMPWAQAAGYSALVLGASLLLPLRGHMSIGQLGVIYFMIFGWAALCGAAGLYFRGLDAERRRRTESVKRDERVGLARDLHDFVAHHVTGIVVQAQAARYLAQTGQPDAAAYERMFADIEQSGLEALTSMRRLVGVLRDGEEAQTAPAESVDELIRLVTEYDKVGPPVSLELAPGLRDTGLPYAVATTVNRIVTEALTNVRKHAHGVTRVIVRVLPVDGAVRVEIVDNGEPGTRWRARTPSGGYGLTGMRERAAVIGGHLDAGWTGQGWRVAAILPLDPKDTRT
ncbi:two-component sensor histidine kinase [Actinorhabdospora filicis]|uniref:histidine kinase n=1 Tax=Actinorhabdospora filicis TaxID=1785913 RepID=A0A9W6SEQ4_9ACTN|nr:histidine kinase [Actinorhabdospora filicis]GLZ75839.1 two-component sensor histidine kinase [Actinorhabdospora filicis]